MIDVKTDTGCALLQQIDSDFEYEQSGHKLFKWLDARAEVSHTQGGLLNADDSLQDVRDFKLPEGELTKEIIILKGAAFKTLYYRQPEARWASNPTSSRHGLTSSQAIRSTAFFLRLARSL